MDKKVDIINKYEVELLQINNILKDLEDGRYYEKTGVKMHGKLAIHVEKLREEINELINKIEYNKDSSSDKMREAVNRLKF